MSCDKTKKRLRSFFVIINKIEKQAIAPFLYSPLTSVYVLKLKKLIAVRQIWTGYQLTLKSTSVSLA
jgi:hypothetical protein